MLHANLFTVLILKFGIEIKNNTLLNSKHSKHHTFVLFLKKLKKNIVFKIIFKFFYRSMMVLFYTPYSSLIIKMVGRNVLTHQK